jgi:hypothetical protein
MKRRTGKMELRKMGKDGTKEGKLEGRTVGKDETKEGGEI